MRRAGAPRTIHIGEVLRHAAVFGRRGSGGLAIAEEEPLSATVSRPFATLDGRGVDYLLVGGIALLQYVEGRNTEDLVLNVALPAPGGR